MDVSSFIAPENPFWMIHFSVRSLAYRSAFPTNRLSKVDLRHQQYGAITFGFIQTERDWVEQHAPDNYLALVRPTTPDHSPDHRYSSVPVISKNLVQGTFYAPLDSVVHGPATVRVERVST